MRTLPPITKNLLLINVVVYLATSILQMRGIDLTHFGGLHFFLASDFQIYQLLTYMFLHANFWHLFSNMFGLWMFGVVIENVWGPKKFLFYYISTGMGAGIVQEIVQFANYYFTGMAAYHTVSMSGTVIPMDAYLNMWTTIGASGAIYAILLAFGMSFPNERIFIFPIPIPIKAKWFVVLYVVLELFLAHSSAGDGVAHYAHLGGMLFGYLMIRYWNRHPDSSFRRPQGDSLFERMRRRYEESKRAQMHAENTGSEPDDWTYNQRKRENQEEIDRILDKIRISGYDSLTKEEKKKLFEASRDR